MDQLRPILEQCKKHLFWIVTGVAVLLGTVAFWLLSGNIADAYTAQETKINSNYTNIQSVSSSASTHPNSHSQEKMQVIIDSVAEEVKAAWEMQYKRQEKFLVWPDEIRKINPRLVRIVEGLHPIELETEYPTKIEGITSSYKKIYARYFDQDMPRLAQIIGVNWEGEAAEASAGSQMGMGGGSDMDAGYGGDTGMGSDYDGGMGGGYGDGGMGGYGSGPAARSNRPRDLVNWSKESQSELLNSIRMWSSNEPTAYEILYTQENMWILEGLLNVIKKTNGNARANFQCIIKEIEFLRIGRTAMGKAGDITGISSAGMYAGMEEDFGAGQDDYGGGGEGDDYYGGEMGGGEEGDVGSSSDPANRRYVDANFVPVTGDDLREKMRSSSPEDAYFAVAKRVPVRMRFSIDQRKVHEFLANCGSADLMLEVRQVRLGDTEPATAAGSSGGGYNYGEGMMQMEGAGMGDPSEGYGTASAAALGPTNFDIDIEVYGIVYLFNPVDLERLGLNEVTEDTELDTTVDDGAASAAAPAAIPANPTQPAAPGEQPPAADPANAGTPAAADPAAGAPAAGDPAAPPPAGG